MRRSRSRTCSPRWNSLAAVIIAIACWLVAVPARAQLTPELYSLDSWILQRYRGAQLLPDSIARGTSAVMQAGAPRIESQRSVNRRDTIVALHFGPAMWRPSLGTATPVQLADPTGVMTGITGRVTARRAFRSPRKPAPRDTVQDDWRIGWAYLVAIPTRSANAAASGFGGWAVQEMLPRAPKPVTRALPVAPAPIPATLPPLR